jgi:hypothetical protein
MALVLRDRVQETGSANTTVSFTLTGAVLGFQDFTVIGNGNVTYYSATDVSGNWEVGIGTYSTTGPTLTRTTILSSSNSNNAVTFSGTVSVFVTYPSSKSVNLDGTNNVSSLGTVASGTWQGSTIGVAYGGTGVTASSGANSVVLRDADQNIAVNRVNQSNTNTTAAGGTTVLTAASTYIHTLVGTGGQTYALPDATTLATGVAFLFNNIATGTLTVQNFAAGSIGTIPSGGAAAVFLTNNATVGGTWDLHSYLPEGVTFGTNLFNLGTAVINGGTWNGGTIGTAYGGTGITTTPANGALLIGNGTGYSSANLTAGTGISVTNASGAITITNTSPSLGGDVVGPASSTDNAIARFDGTTGKLIQNSAVTIGDTGNTVISVTDNTNAALRITQLGTGNAILVEDSANPDASPFVVDASGNVGIGKSPSGNALEVTREGFGTSVFNSAGASAGSYLYLQRSRGTTSVPVVSNAGDRSGGFVYRGFDGTNFLDLGAVSGDVDGTPGTNDMPGRLVFSTTADGASTPTERMRIDSAGRIGIGATPAAGRNLTISSNITGSTSPIAVFSNGTIQSDATASVRGFATQLSTAASAFTVSNLEHFRAIQGTIGATSAVTNQTGFVADSSLVGATNNFGFFGNIASGTGRWNFYANGTADNYFAGQVQLGAGTVGAPALSAFGDTNTGIFFPAADTIAFSEGGVESMRIDASGNVGIGTSSPSSYGKLSVNGNVVLGPYTRNQAGTQTIGIYTSGDPAADDRAFIGFTTVAGASSSNSYMTFNTNNYGVSGGERMRITSAGGISFGSSGTAYGTSGQVLTSNGNSPPTWTAPSSGITIGLARAISINCILP